MTAQSTPTSPSGAPTSPPTSTPRWRGPVFVGLASALLAAAAYGVTQTLARHLVTTSAPPQVGAVYTILFGMLILFGMSVRSMRQDLKAPRIDIGLMALAGIASSFGVLFMFGALSLAPVTLASPIAAVNPLIAIALTHVFLQRVERVTPRMLFGAVLVFGGVLLVVLGRA
jgi:drug/metabolite transporter (DMT)-like permease